MKSQAVCIDRADHSMVQATDVKEPDQNQILIQTLYTIISPGTELAIYRDDFWSTLPYFPGYGAVGKVLQVGSDVSHVHEDDQLFCYNGHAQYSLTDAAQPICVFSETADPKQIVFTRMAAVSMTALRVSPPELGDWVAIQGLGLVGNFAAQLFALAGARVIVIEPAEARREQAQACGIEHILDPSDGDLKATVMALTDGEGVRTLVEATGIPALVEPGCALIAKGGEIVLLGSPRGELQGNVTSLLNQIHLWGNGCITLKGAHEWRYPRLREPNVKHSIQRNCEVIIDLIERKKLIVDPLLTHVVPPDQCQVMYQGLRHQPNAHLGVLLDWTAADS